MDIDNGDNVVLNDNKSNDDQTKLSSITIYEWMVDGMQLQTVKDYLDIYGLSTKGKAKELKQRLQDHISTLSHKEEEDEKNLGDSCRNQSKMDNSIINNITEYKREQLELLNSNTLKKICKVKKIPSEEYLVKPNRSITIQEISDKELIESIITTQGISSSLHEYHRGLVNYTLPITIIFKILRYDCYNKSRYALKRYRYNGSIEGFGKININYLMISKQLFHFATLQLFNTFGIQYYSNKTIMGKVLVTRFHNPVCVLKNITTLGVDGSVLNDVSGYIQSSNSLFKEPDIFKGVRHLVVVDGPLNDKVSNLFSPDVLCKLYVMRYNVGPFIEKFQWKTLKLEEVFVHSVMDSIKYQTRIKHLVWGTRLYNKAIGMALPNTLEKLSLRYFRFDTIPKEVFTKLTKLKFYNSINFISETSKELFQLCTKLTHLTIGNAELNEVDLRLLVYIKELAIIPSQITYVEDKYKPQSTTELLSPANKIQEIMDLQSIMTIKMKPILSCFKLVNDFTVTIDPTKWLMISNDSKYPRYKDIILKRLAK